MTLLSRALILCLGLALPVGLNAQSPALQHASPYKKEALNSTDVSQYWVSEKFDGVRGYWDGTQLLTRQGYRIHAPAWFTAPLPAVPMDGELWMGRNTFSRLSAAVRRTVVDDSYDQEWRNIRYMIFDLPKHEGRFSERVEAMRTLTADANTPWLQTIRQYRVESETQLMTELQRVVDAGGEGLMLHHQDAVYKSGRTDSLLKLKRWDDAEGKVIAHLPGKGKYNGMMGALLLETPEGLQFRLGTGFTDDQRRNPPAIGEWVTFKFTGYTKKGKPRFASFLRIRSGFK